jgi:ABC-type transport system involved in multi-copper enzyme maturation permease subunit
MRAYELLRETLFRKTYVWVAHLSCLVIYGLFWLLFLPSGQEAGVFIFLWGGFFLPLALSAGIFGDDIASGRIRVLATKPFWLGQFYIYRLLGLSLQGAAHLLMAGAMILALDTLMGQGTPNRMGLWLFASWLLFNATIALSTTVSVVVRRGHNSLLVFLGVALLFLLLDVLSGYWLEHGTADFLRKLMKFAGLPFGLLRGMAQGEYGKFSFAAGKYGFTKSLACTVHCVILTIVYATIGVHLLTKREFSSQRD